MRTRTSDFGFSNKCTFYNKLDTFWGGPPHTARNSSREEAQDVILSTLADGFLPLDGQNFKDCQRGTRTEYIMFSSACLWNENLFKKSLILSKK